MIVNEYHAPSSSKGRFQALQQDPKLNLKDTAQPTATARREGESDSNYSYKLNAPRQSKTSIQGSTFIKSRLAETS
jgi:hypothetical protein